MSKQFQVYNRDSVLAWIIQFKKDHDGNSPTIREIMEGYGISSTSVVNYILAGLERERRITLSGKGKARAICIPGGQWSYRP